MVALRGGAVSYERGTPVHDREAPGRLKGVGDGVGVGVWVQGFGFGVWGLGIRVFGLGIKV